MLAAVDAELVFQVSIRLRSVGPEKLNVWTQRARAWLFQSVSGLWDRRNSKSPPWPNAASLFQSVSGLWDRRNPRCPGQPPLQRVSIRLRSVGPEK